MTEELTKRLKELVGLMGFDSFDLDANPDRKFVSITVRDSFLTPERVPNLVVNLNRVARLFAKQLGSEPVLVDVNNYRRERENLIIELARAAARKAVAAKEPVPLPTMNAYERRLVHTELSMRPDVTTESVGEGKNRYVVVKVIED
jgi:predicted RNA-binding protein Jag